MVSTNEPMQHEPTQHEPADPGRRAGAAGRAGADGASPKPAISRDDVAHLAYLARLDIPDEDLETYAEQLDVILSSVAEVSKVATDDIEPTSHAVPLVNVFREDTVKPGLTRDEALAMAPAAEADRFRVPQILGEEQ